MTLQKYERGDDWIRIFKGDMGYFQENLRKFVFTPTQMANLFTSPVQMLPAPPSGFAFMPSFAIMSKPADPAGGTYGAGAATNIDIQWAATGVAAIRIRGVVFSATLTGTAALRNTYWQGTQNTGGSLDPVLQLANYVDSPVQLVATGGNLTVNTTSPFIILMGFRLFPMLLPLA